MKEKHQDWTTEINELETWFNKHELPKCVVSVNQQFAVLDAKAFIDSHITMSKANNGKTAYLPFLERLRSFKKRCIEINCDI